MTEVRGAPLEAGQAREAIRSAGLLVNATSLGRGALSDASPLDDGWDCLHPGVVCVDSNYSPPVTRLMEQVRKVNNWSDGYI